MLPKGQVVGVKKGDFKARAVGVSNFRSGCIKSGEARRIACPQIVFATQPRGEFTPENLVFNANLQKFSQRISLIVGLETGGKLSPQAAYEKIEELWKILQRSQEQLKIE